MFRPQTGWCCPEARVWGMCADLPAKTTVTCFLFSTGPNPSLLDTLEFCSTLQPNPSFSKVERRLHGGQALELMCFLSQGILGGTSPSPSAAGMSGQGSRASSPWLVSRSNLISALLSSWISCGPNPFPWPQPDDAQAVFHCVPSTRGF